jgi:hypothetical protein
MAGRVRIFAAVGCPLCLLAFQVISLSAQAPVRTVGEANQWMVAYDNIDTRFGNTESQLSDAANPAGSSPNSAVRFSRSLIGTLQLDGGVLRYRALSGHLSWVVQLASVLSIREEEIAFYTKKIPTIVIDSVEGDRFMRRRVAVVREDLEFVRSLPIVFTLQKRLARVSGERATASGPQPLSARPLPQ